MVSYTLSTMGQGASQTGTSFNHPFNGDIQSPGAVMDHENYQKGYRRVQPRRAGSVPIGTPSRQEPADLHKQLDIVNSGFCAVWRVVTRPDTPKPMSGMFSASGHELSYLGFVNADEIWEFSHAALSWRRIRLTGHRINRRRGCCAIVYDNDLIVFGGKSERGTLHNDLLRIDPRTGAVTLIEATLPELSYAVMTVFSGRVFIWGGIDRDKVLNGTLFEVDITTGAVARHDIGFKGRKNPGWFVDGAGLFVYGSSQEGLLRIDLDMKTAVLLETSGTPPPTEPPGGRFGRAGEVALYFGGKGSAKFAPLYGLNLERRWWFVFPVVPDGLTASIADGRVNASGYFCLPRVHSFGMCYWAPQRMIMAFPGSPETETPVVSVLALGEALPAVALRDDMLRVLEMGVDSRHEAGL